MKKEHFEKLQPFLHRKSARQRVILYLVAYGYSASKILALTADELRALKLPVDMQVSRDEMLYGCKSGPAFLYPSGNPIRVTDCKRVVKEAAIKVLGKPMSLELFRAYINPPSKKE